MNERLDAILENYSFNYNKRYSDKRINKVFNYMILNGFETVETLKKENLKLKRENKRLNAIIDRLEDRIDRLTDKNKNNPSYLRKTKEYKEFRKEVLKRDNYRCAKCGETENLQVHHIKPVKDYPNLVMNFDNVQTLCLLCHSKTESYLKKKKEKK